MDFFDPVEEGRIRRPANDGKVHEEHIRHSRAESHQVGRHAAPTCLEYGGGTACKVTAEGRFPSKQKFFLGDAILDLEQMVREGCNLIAGSEMFEITESRG